MQLFMFFIDSNTLHVSGVTCPSSGAQELFVQPMVPYTNSSWAPDDGQVTPETCRVLLSKKEHKKSHLVGYLYDLCVVFNN
jgi:hypothetical protein